MWLSSELRSETSTRDYVTTTATSECGDKVCLTQYMYLLTNYVY